MTKVRVVLAGFALATVALLGQFFGSQFFGSQPVSAQGTATPAPSTVTVQGTGQTSAAPDIATVVLGVESIGPDVGKAISEVNTKQQAILDKLKALGIADKDIQTINFSVNVDRSRPNVPGQPQGPLNYQVVNTAQVKIRKIDQLATVIETAVAAGANNIYGVNLSIADTTTLATESRTKAVADARVRAEALAKAAGMKLGRIISISEGFAGGPVPFAADARAASSGGFQTGELQVSAQVQVVFALEAQ